VTDPDKSLEQTLVAGLVFSLLLTHRPVCVRVPHASTACHAGCGRALARTAIRVYNSMYIKEAAS